MEEEQQGIPVYGTGFPGSDISDSGSGLTGNDMSAAGAGYPENSGESPPPIFFCDTMLGRLARWLRLLGYDAAYEPEIDDWVMLRRCMRAHRLLLTRDRGVLERWQIGRGMVKALLIESGKVQEQLKEVVDRLGLVPAAEARCPEDNTVLVELTREDAEGRVPPYVFKTQSEYRVCPSCGRIYWKATHWEKIDAIRRDAAARHGL